ncbi:MAG: MGMT family protein [Gemmatimonadetes bacterium]|nr:MGMT family protein [Gemmatimonadota bacterium]
MTSTDFQKAVWSHVRQIPPGKVTTYGNIAEALGKPGAAQAVGEAVKSVHPMCLGGASLG